MTTKSIQSFKEYLKARRPERFSDSTRREVTAFDRSMLEFHLDSITSRSQEGAFEDFAKALIQAEICPNLLPHTGPTGGGDSKVDSETTPVSDTLALTWHIGAGTLASKERWAFAFSAKRQWKSKLQGDILKIKKTDRNYKKAFFVSNQSIPDRKRAEVEDELRKKHRIDVRIFDREWILDKILGNNRQQLAIDILKVSGQLKVETHEGPLDLQRSRRLEELEQRIKDDAAKRELSFATVNDCIDAAALSRELERPLVETLGRLDRSESMAAQFGTNAQRLQCAYDRAWTTFFWFEDAAGFVKAYDCVEAIALGSDLVGDVQKLGTLWHLLCTLNPKTIGDDPRTKALLGGLAKFSGRRDRPSSALQAKSLGLMTSMSVDLSKGEAIEPHIDELSKVVDKAARLLGFPFEELADSLLALSGILLAIPEYERLHDKLVSIVSARQGDIAGGRLLVERAEKQLEMNRPVDALRTIGGALHKLAKDETRATLCRALYCCACIYERLGLLWAARGSLLTAASIAFIHVADVQSLSDIHATLTGRLKWVELQLGRLPQVLTFYRSESFIRSILAAKERDESKAVPDEEFDLALAVVMLRLDLGSLPELSSAPDLLYSLGLERSAAALLYVLGHTELVTGSDERMPEPDKSVFVSWRDLPGADELPSQLVPTRDETTTFSGSALGCLFSIKTPCTSPYLDVAESLLAAIQGTLATGIVRRVATQVSKLDIAIVPSDTCDPLFEFKVTEGVSEVSAEVMCRGFDSDALAPTLQIKFKQQMCNAISHILARVLFAPTKSVLDMLTEDFALPRTIDFTSSIMHLGNVVGSKRKVTMEDWRHDDATVYASQRVVPWDADVPKPPVSPRHKGDKALDDEDWMSRIDYQTIRHGDVKTISVIRESLWNDAGWRGLGFLTYASRPPILVVGFTNQEPAKRIFESWISEFGAEDKEGKIRIAIVTGISQSAPYHYRVIISPAMPKHDGQSDRVAFFALGGRVHTMEPDNGENLKRFLESYREHDQCEIAPGLIDAADRFCLWPSFIGPKQIVLKEAWQVGRGDPERMAVLPEDDPIIPKGVVDPPILEWRSIGSRVETTKVFGKSKPKGAQRSKRDKPK